MRKYFLLSAAALMVATSANATTDYAEVTARATIEVAGTLDCTDMDFGTIVVKSGRTESTVVNMGPQMCASEAEYDEKHVLSVSGEGCAAFCNSDGYMIGDEATFNVPASVKLTGTNGSLDVALTSDASGAVGGALTIPADVKAGDYEGHFTVTTVR